MYLGYSLVRHPPPPLRLEVVEPQKVAQWHSVLQLGQCETATPWFLLAPSTALPWPHLCSPNAHTALCTIREDSDPCDAPDCGDNCWGSLLR